MPTVELAAGTIEYQDTGGGGPVVVLLQGLAMNGSLWRHVVRELGGDHRCVVPTLPLGGHRRPMRADADLSPRGIGRLEAQFREALDLRDVTLVGNDSGLFLFVAGQCAGRISRLVVTSCESFENFPPRLPGRAVALAGRLPGGLNALVQPSRLRMLRRLRWFWAGWPSGQSPTTLRAGAHLRMPAGVNHVSAATADQDCLEFITQDGKFDFTLAAPPMVEHRAPDDRRQEVT